MVDTALRIHVHDDSRVLDGMLLLVELARQEQPLADTLSAMCRLIAGIAAVDVVSIYLREGNALVMRGNVGFPADAVGRVRLGLDEGLTGVVAGRRRPVTVAAAQADDRYKHIDGIGEEHFAAYLGVPLVLDTEVAGVLVMQRRAEGAFTDADVSLASSLTGSIIFALERHRDRHGGHTAPCFAGKCLVTGHAIGPALVMPSPAAKPASAAAALHALELDLVTAAQRLGPACATATRALDNLAAVAVALRSVVASGRSADTLAQLQHAPYHATSGAKDLTALVDERNREVSELWAFLLVDMQHRLPICGSLLVVRSLGSFVALEAIARGAAAVIVTETAHHSAREILEAAAVPAITITNLVVTSGDPLELDATSGIVRKLRP
jgi:putative methionine-R-sulfoxide reductase with GAF domain